ncbi:hypothetical protein Vau01_104440 [Virgisporangium aurantiacum]|uniref:PknH-like extracellular domain-containing protein n=1 Tax=Virgisporangium aurantiacum TaxID=175570 RepID=A0A8J3ZHI9_9ACTN|nr:hypothetical protein Vau01_104440 [Virgisporangium aurantiacum]
MAFTVLAVVSSVGLTLSASNTPYAAELPAAPGPVAPAEPSSAAPVTVTPSSASPRSAQPRRTPSATPSTSAVTTPTSTGPIPPEAMLSASDLGAGVTGNEERVDDRGSLATMLSYCGRSPAAWGKRVDHLGFRQRWLRYPNEMYAVQELSRQPAQVAPKLISEARAMFGKGGPCATVPIGGNAENVGTFMIVDSAWGDESLLMRETRTVGGPPAWRILIRQGDLITEIRIAVDGFTSEQAVDLGRRAAQRMCAATPTC